MIKKRLIFIILVGILVGLSRQATAQITLRNILKDPAVSLRCKELIKERQEKLEVKQKAQFLMRKSEGIEENSPDRKLSIKRKMKVSQAKLRRKIFVVGKQIERMEDHIIRTGCPGIRL